MENIYVAQTAQGGDTGVDAANAHSAAWFNTSGNWANPKVAGKIGPGDTVHLCGTITTALVTMKAGNSGSPITIAFESGAKLSSPAWATNTGGINIFHEHITIDGMSVGIIECTDNGEGLGHALNSLGVWGNGVGNITVKNLTVQNIYVRSRGFDAAGAGAFGIILQASGGSISNLLVQNCTVHDAATGIVMEYTTGCSAYTATGNTIYNINHGITVPDRNNASTITGLLIENNHVYNFTNWTYPDGSNPFHHNAVFVWAVQTGGTSEVIDAKIIGNTFGPGLDGAYQTSLFFSQGNISRVDYWNNLHLADPGEWASGALAELGSWHPGAVFTAFNNTFVTGGLGIALSCGISLLPLPGTMTATIMNNLGIGLAAGGTFIIYSIEAGSTATIDYNIGYNFSPTSFYGTVTGGAFTGKSIAQWHTLGNDTNGLNSDPLLNGSYKLQSGSPAINAGADLSAYFTTDKDGNTRVVPFDMGAYEFTGSTDRTFRVEATRTTRIEPTRNTRIIK